MIIRTFVERSREKAVMAKTQSRFGSGYLEMTNFVKLKGLLDHLFAHANPSDVGVHAARVDGHPSRKLEIGVAWRRVGFVILEAVQILVAFPADLAFVWLLLFHAESTRIWRQSGRVDNGESPIGVFVELLIVVAVL